MISHLTSIMMTIKETFTSVTTTRESITYTCRKKTIYLFKRIPTAIVRKYSKRKVPEHNNIIEEVTSGQKDSEVIQEDDSKNKDKDVGISAPPEDNYRELDYYLGYKTEEDMCWRDPVAEEILRKDFYVRHCDVSEEDYNRKFKSSALVLTDVSCSTASLSNNRKVPSRRYRRRLRKSQYEAERRRSKKRNKKKKYEKRGYLKFITRRKELEDSTDSSSDLESAYGQTSRQGSSCETILRSSQDGLSDADKEPEKKHITFSEATTVFLPNIDTDHSDEIRRPSVQSSPPGVLIREVDEGQPCDNCPELCGGFIPHPWRKTCKSCGCARTDHAVYHEEACDVRARLGLREETNSPTSAPTAQLDWAPPGLNAKQAEAYFAMLPGAETASAAARRRWRTRALATQLPRQDLAAEHNKHLSDKHRADYEDFVAARNEIALDVGYAVQHHGAPSECPTCQKVVRPGTITVVAPKISEELVYHPGCFSCSTCHELLVELAYCALDGRPYCERHYAETLKPRCDACDEFRKMGLLLSVLISYGGVVDALEWYRHVSSGMIPDDDPDFSQLVSYYNELLRRTNGSSCNSANWTEQSGQGYLCLEESGGKAMATVKYYSDGSADSTNLLFSTKISSFGQDSLESEVGNNQGSKSTSRTPERYTTSVKTQIPQTDQSFSIGGLRNRSTTASYEKLSDPTRQAPSSGDSLDEHRSEVQTHEDTQKEKIKWHYRPISPDPASVLPTINFQSYEHEPPDFKHDPNSHYSEDFLRSLDGVKFRPLQRTDPSGRRRTYKKRNSSSSTSSRDSRASREEELRVFTSLEEAEFEHANKNSPEYASAPNLTTRYSSSRSRETSNERPDLVESTENESDKINEQNPPARSLTKLDSFEEEDPPVVTSNQDPPKDTEVTEEGDEEDFWGKSTDW